MEPLADRLAAGDILLADGATGTMLLERGLEPGQCPESVTLSHPELLVEVGRLYVEAGADIIETNTFGASPLRLAQHGLGDRTEELNREAVRAARKAAAERVYVAASCGPSGRLLKPYGDTDPQQVYDGFRLQMECLVAAGVDCVCVETMIDLAEAKLAIQAAKETSPTTPVMATMTFDATPRGFYTLMGVSVADAAAGLKDAGADVIGSNCGNGIESMITLAKELHRHSDLPLIIQPNAGLPETRDGKTVYNETPGFTAEKAVELITTGVSIIGGCCGTTPDHTAALRAVIGDLS
jgi:5-methyltetrahydrofolate--homocysteine methyltransferase